MALDDYVESEVAIAAAAAAVIFSPRIRGVLRKGAVYGLAGALVAGDAIGSFARGVGRGAQNAASTTADVAGNAVAATTAVVGNAAGATADTARNAAGAAPDTTSATLATPEAAAEELVAVAQGTTDGTTTTGRRSQRAPAEQTKGALNE